MVFELDDIPLEQELQFEGVFEPPTEPVNPYENVYLTTKNLVAGWLFTMHYWDLVLTNRGLQRLCLLHKASLQWTVKSREFIYDVLRGMKDLKELCAFDVLDMTHLGKMHELVPTVETVTVTKVQIPSVVQGSAASGDGFNAQLIGVNPSVKSLSFVWFIFNPGTRYFEWPRHPSIQDVLLALSRLPNLEHLSLIDIENRGVPTTSSDLPPPTTLGIQTHSAQGSSLRKLDISDTRNLEPLLFHLSNLRELKVDDLSDKAFEVLGDSCKMLEVLEWKRKPTSSSERSGSRPARDVLHKFLVSCSSLKVFDGFGRFINADDMIREPWACQKIEKLRCKIVGVWRLDRAEELTYQGILQAYPMCQDDIDLSGIMSVLSDAGRDVMQKLQHSREQQRQVYERLASLEHLRHLDLGYENRRSSDTRYPPTDGGPVPDSLELSLESGLDQLVALKDLQMFGFEGVNNQWNIQFIPKLWHTIDDSLQSWERILFTYHSDPNNLHVRSRLSAWAPSSITDGKDEDWIRGIFAKYGHHIRRLKVHWIILVDAASTSGVCTDIQDLEINLNMSNDQMICWNTRYEGEIQDRRFEGVFGSSLPSLPKLNPLRHAAYPIFKEKMRGMKELEELCAIEIMDMTPPWKLQELVPTVKILTGNKTHMFPGVHDSTASEDGFNAQLIKANPFVRFVCLPFTSPMSGHPSITDTIVVLSQFPNLEYLNLTTIENHGAIPQESLSRLSAIPDTLTPLEQGSTLTRLDIDDTGDLVPLL
ncbi:hypothetical protein BGZ65_007219, partial [Modicella reniformis]